MSDDENFEIEGSELAEEDPMRAFFPASFGKKAKQADIAEQIGRTKRKVEKPFPITDRSIKIEEEKEDDVKSQTRIQGQNPASEDDFNDDSDSDSDSDDDDNEDEFPVSHELILKTHDKPVTSITLDPSGSRLISGSNDCTIKLHDFASMTPSTLRSFKSVDPSAKKDAANSETHPINHVEFNPLAGGQFLCVSAHPQAKVMNRDGEVLAEFVKGDMYLRDMHNTKGHVSEITSGTWNPFDKNVCVTTGTDSTVRIWDVNFRRSQKVVIVHKSRAAGSAGRTRMTAIAWKSNMLVAAALDGSLVMWSGDGPYARPVGEIRDAHKPDTWTGGVDISSDGRMIVTRGGDDTIKLWDSRKFKAPVVTVSHPSTSTHYSMTNIKYSPNASNIITGSASGHLHILNSGNLQAELVTPVTPGFPLITVIWHPKINQIVTGSSNAEVHVLYNPNTSLRGAVDVMSRAPKMRHVDDDPNFTTDTSAGISGDSVVNQNGVPNSASFSARHPTIGLTASGKSRDPRRPQIPAQTPFMKSQPDEQYVNQSIGLSSMRDEDPREALLKYAELAKEDPLFTNAWKDTQPKTQYADISDEDEDAEPDKKKVKRS